MAPLRTPEQPRPFRSGRRAPAGPLTRGRIVEAALAEIEAEGLAAFSTRKLGQRLGCEAMSIYHHFPSKQHLLDALVDHAIGSVELPPPGPDPVARLRRTLYAYRAMAHRVPALYPLVALHRLNTPTGVAFIESVLALVQAIVPGAEAAARHFRVLGYYLMGACLDETSGYARGPSAAEPVSDDVVLRECPRLVAAARYFQRDAWDETFALGCEALLAAIVVDVGPADVPA